MVTYSVISHVHMYSYIGLLYNVRSCTLADMYLFDYKHAILSVNVFRWLTTCILKISIKRFGILQRYSILHSIDVEIFTNVKF